MTLKDKLLEIKPKAPSGVDGIMSQLDKETANVLTSLLSNPEVSHYSIWQVLKDEGYSISRETVTSYRKKIFNS